MGFRPGGPNPSSAAKNPRDLARMITTLQSRITQLERGTSHQAVNPTQQSQVVTIPPTSRLKVNGDRGTGQYRVGITVPQLISPPRGTARNQSSAPIWHEVSYSPSANFSRNITTLPASTQTAHSIVAKPGETIHVRSRSSYDGKKWGAYVRTGPVKG